MIGNVLNEAFKDLGRKKDYAGLRECVAALIRNDPTFESGKYDEVEDYLLKNGLQNIFQPYERVPGEPEHKGKADWDETYFANCAYALIENFSRERLAHVKEVGEYVYRDKPTPGKEEALYNNIKNRLIKELNIDKKKIDRLRIVWNDGDNKDILKNNIMKAIKEII